MRYFNHHFKLFLALTLVLIGLMSWTTIPETLSSPREPDQAKYARVSKNYGRIPMSFEVNQGQADSHVKFISRGNGYGLWLTATEAVLTIRMEEGGRMKDERKTKASSYSTLRMRLVGANRAPQVEGLDQLHGHSNYFLGNDPREWRTNVANYAKVLYREAYPGIDLIYYGNQRQLEYDFVVYPGADPKAIRLAYRGARRMRLDRSGDLVLSTAGGELFQHKPVVYQEVSGSRRTVEGRYVIHGDREVGFQIGAYDLSRPLVIDPVLVYSTYLGGSKDDIGFGIFPDRQPSPTCKDQ